MHLSHAVFVDSYCVTRRMVVSRLLILALLLVNAAYSALGILSDTTARRSFYATCSQGVAPILAGEITKLPEVDNLKQVKSGVFFTGTTKSGYSALMNLRTSLRLMEQVNVGEEGDSDHLIDSPQGLYDYCFDKIKWEEILGPDLTFSVSMSLGKEVPQELTHSHFSALTIKDALVDRILDKFDERPSVDKREPLVPIMSHLHKGQLSVYRCWSGGSSLHKRGYRGDTIHKAALRETLGAAIVLASNWNGDDGTILLDPMGGSGTVCIEAALIACDTAPGLIRYGKRLPVPCAWPDLRERSESEWEEVVAEAREKDKRQEMSREKKIIQYNDFHEGSIDLAEEASERAGVYDMIDFSSSPCDVAHLEPPSSKFQVTTNPPWDRRLHEDAEESWDGLRAFLERATAAADVYCLAGEPSLVRRLGLKPRSNLALHVGEVEMILIKFSKGQE